jgi:hypothetical protein
LLKQGQPVLTFSLPAAGFPRLSRAQAIIGSQEISGERGKLKQKIIYISGTSDSNLQSYPQQMLNSLQKIRKKICKNKIRLL